jgi:hypothetical protein
MAIADASSTTRGDVPSPGDDERRVVLGHGRRACAWCGTSLLQERRGTVFCGRKCRQSAFRLRRRRDQVSATPALATGATFAYADPPYPGMAKRYYENEPTYAGEVDHAALIASLTAAISDGKYAGWALSTSSKALRDILPLCPPGARVCAWVKPIGVPEATYGAHSTWEPVIVVGGRKLPGGIRDWLRAMPARGGGILPGRKPIAFCAWLFDLLGMLPGDKLHDLFPGTGIVGRSWDELSSRTPTREASPGHPGRLRFQSFVDERRVADDVVGDSGRSDVERSGC